MPDLQSELKKLSPKRAAPQRAMRSPVNTSRLVDLVGRNKAAEMTGLTPSGLSTALLRDKISATVEIAATLIVEKMQAESKQPTEDTVVFLRIPPEKLAAVDAVLKALGMTVHKV